MLKLKFILAAGLPLALLFFACGKKNVITVACNDGTGETDCCPPGVQEGGECSGDGSCWTRCSQGVRSQLFCGYDGTWGAGKGVYPCGPPCSDAGLCGDGAVFNPVPCDDGTGATDCCPDGVEIRTPCTRADSICWTRCTAGSRTKLLCNLSFWRDLESTACGADSGGGAPQDSASDVDDGSGGESG